MADGQQGHADNGPQRLATGFIVRQRHGPGHHAQPQGPDRRRQGLAMDDHTPTQRQNTQHDGEDQPDLMDDRRSEHPSGGRQQGEKHGRGDTVNDAQT